MNYLVKLSSIVALAYCICACQPSSNQESAETAEDNPEAASATEVEAATSDALINPNLASEEELQSAGLDAGTISQIIEKRPFLSMTDFDTLLGDAMDSTQKAALYGSLFVPFNLNTTPEDDFKLIPGVGDRMAHEFEEYRPYAKIQQFRTEIGKYVDESEVERFEKYVFVPVELNTATEEEILALPGVGDRMAHEFEEYRPYQSIEQFRKEIGKYVDDKELSRLERFVYLNEEGS